MLQRKLHCNADSHPFLLNNPVAVLPLLKFIHSTGHFKSHFGKDQEDKIVTKACQNAELRREAEKLNSAVNNTINCTHNH